MVVHCAPGFVFSATITPQNQSFVLRSLGDEQLTLFAEHRVFAGSGKGMSGCWLLEKVLLVGLECEEIQRSGTGKFLGYCSEFGDYMPSCLKRGNEVGCYLELDEE